MIELVEKTKQQKRQTDLGQWLDSKFSKYKIYRRIKGGSWYHVKTWTLRVKQGQRSYPNVWSSTRPASGVKQQRLYTNVWRTTKPTEYYFSTILKEEHYH